jgi:hypothetical protein
VTFWSTSFGSYHCAKAQIMRWEKEAKASILHFPWLLIAT